MISVKKLRIIYCSTITTMYIQLDRIFVGLEKNAEELRKMEREGDLCQRDRGNLPRKPCKERSSISKKCTLIDTHSYSYSTV